MFCATFVYTRATLMCRIILTCNFQKRFSHVSDGILALSAGAGEKWPPHRHRFSLSEACFNPASSLHCKAVYSA